MLLQYIHIIFLPHDAIYFVKCTSPCSKAPPNMMLPPQCFKVGMVCFGLQAPPFFSKHNDGHYGQTDLFLFHQTRGHFSKKYELCPHVQLQTVGWLFKQFWSSGFFLAERPFRLCRYRYFCTCFLQHLHTLLCCSGIDLHFSHQSTFSSGRQNASPS